MVADRLKCVNNSVMVQSTTKVTAPHHSTFRYIDYLHFLFMFSFQSSLSTCIHACIYMCVYMIIYVQGPLGNPVYVG